MGISFINIEVQYNLPDKKRLKNWLNSVSSEYGYSKLKLNYNFCSDEYVLKINKEYLRHTTYTDIITFPYLNEKPNLEGEVFISVERIKENAQKYVQDENTEMNRVIIHGLLHLLGYSDKTKELKKFMTEKEDFYLSLL